jgi:hypothetical protein
VESCYQNNVGFPVFEESFATTRSAQFYLNNKRERQRDRETVLNKADKVEGMNLQLPNYLPLPKYHRHTHTHSQQHTWNFLLWG